jgi:predicted small secreted protein
LLQPAERLAPLASCVTARNAECPMKRFIHLFLLAGVLIAPLALTACNTSEGFGRDVERSGEWIQKKTGSDDPK